MTRHTRHWTLAAMAGGLALAGPSGLRAQDATGAAVGAPRSADQRVVTEGVVPRTANSVARDAAEGRLAPVPPAVAPRQGVGPAAAADPATRPIAPAIPGGTVPADPATRLQPAVVAPAPAPAGLDVAMLIEHAVAMAIEGSALQSIAQQANPGGDANDPARMLLDHARQEMAESKALMTRAATDGRDVSAASPSRRFYSAANNYLTALNALASQPAPPSPADQAKIALVNHSVKSVLDAGHIRQMSRATAGSAALEQLVNHATDMRTMGTQTILRVAGNNPAPADGAPSVAVLAQRGRELVDAADQLAAANPVPAAMTTPARGGIVPAANPASLAQPGANVGVLRDVRPEIIGGTQATGSPTAGTATGPGAAANVRNAREGANGTLNPPIPTGAPGSGTSNYGVGNNNTPPTNSTGNLPPR